MRRPFYFWIGLGAVLTAWLLHWRGSAPQAADRLPGCCDAEHTHPPGVLLEADPGSPETSGALAQAEAVVLHSVFLAYGSGEGQLGFFHAPEQEPAGPESFTVDGEGRIWIADTLNQRIQVLDPLTVGTRQFPLPPDVAVGDLVSTADGGIVIYDYAGRLFSFDAAGNPSGSVEIDRDRWAVRLELRRVGDRIVMQCADQFDHWIAVVDGSGLRLPTEAELAGVTGDPGHVAPSGRRYLAALERWERGWIEITEPGAAGGEIVPLTGVGVVSVRFLGEDERGGFHLQVERVEEERVLLEVHSFSAVRHPAGVLRIPANDYYFWTAKLLTVDPRGRIVQALPGEEGMEFNVFTPPSSASP